MATLLQAIVGLGNPGPRYEYTRHNAGYWLLDRLAADFGASFRAEKKMRGELASVTIGGQKVWLLKPDTFVNRSGESVQALTSYYRLAPESVLLVYDELDLEAGDLRFKADGGHGGHNGLRDIFSRTGQRSFPRLRIGIGHPGHRDQVTGYVLGRPSAVDRRAIEEAMDKALQLIPQYVNGEWEKATHQLHTDMRGSAGRETS